MLDLGGKITLEETAQELAETLNSVTIEEFRIEDFRFERDCRIGRRLLYLLANNDWIRRTTETINIQHIRSVETQLSIDVDLSYINHTVFSEKKTRLWLPILSLPAAIPPRNTSTRRSRHIKDAVTSVEVTDSTGTRQHKVNQAEIAHSLAAVITEILIDQFPLAHIHRDEKVLLAAAIRRILPGLDAQTPTSVHHDTPQTANADQSRDRQSRRLLRARKHLAPLIDAALDSPNAHALRKRLLDRPALEILHSVIGTTFVVVALKDQQEHQSFMVHLPARRLVLNLAKWFHLRPRTLIDIDLLTPTTHADRLIRLSLPTGVDAVDIPSKTRQDSVRIDVTPPRPLAELTALMSQLLHDLPHPDSVEPAAWRITALAKMAATKAEAASESLRHYDVLEFTVQGKSRISRRINLTPQLTELSEALSHFSKHPTPEVIAALIRIWDNGLWIPQPTSSTSLPASSRNPRRIMRRIAIINSASPGQLQARIPAVESFSQRAAPGRSHIRTGVSLVQSTVLDTANDVNKINLIVLLLIGLAVIFPSSISRHLTLGEIERDSLTTLLTLFPAIQASRLEKPDFSSLKGLLARRNYLLSLCTPLPALGLAVTIALYTKPIALIGSWIAAVTVQALLQIMIPNSLEKRRRSRWLNHRFLRSSQNNVLRTSDPRDHSRLDFLRSSWCRSLTAEALSLGNRTYVYGFTKPEALASILRVTSRTQPADQQNTSPNIVGLMSHSIAGQISTIAMVESASENTRAQLRRLSDGNYQQIDSGLLMPLEPPEWIVEVLVGIPHDQADNAADHNHPLAHVVRCAHLQNLPVLFVQLPSPPPQNARGELEWIRCRIGVPFEQANRITLLAQFLAELEELQKPTAHRSACELRVSIVPELATYEISETATADDEDLLRIRGRNAQQLWFPSGPADPDQSTHGSFVAQNTPLYISSMYANARLGLVNDILHAVSSTHPEIAVLSMSMAVIHGLSIVSMVTRATAEARPGPSHMCRDVCMRLDPSDRATVIINGQPVIAWPEQDYSWRPTWASVRSRLLRYPAADNIVLCRIQIRTPDSPGVLEELIRWITWQPGHTYTNLSPWFALFRLVDGRSFQGRLIVPLTRERALGLRSERETHLLYQRIQALTDPHASPLDSDSLVEVDIVRSNMSAQTTTIDLSDSNLDRSHRS